MALKPNLTKKAFLGYLQLASWLLSVIGTFVISSPFDLPGNENVVAGYSKFFLAIFLALFSYPLFKYGKPAYAGKWWRLAIVLFIIGLLAVPGYLHILKTKTVYYEIGKGKFTTMVVGNELSKEGQDAKKEIERTKVVATNKDIVDYFAIQSIDDLQNIWSKGIELNNNLLLALHSLIIFLLGALLLSCLQAIKSQT